MPRVVLRLRALADWRRAPRQVQSRRGGCAAHQACQPGAGFPSADRTVSQIPDAMVQYLPQSDTEPRHTDRRKSDDHGLNCASTAQDFGVYAHLGNTVFMPDRPCANCGQGFRSAPAQAIRSPDVLVGRRDARDSVGLAASEVHQDPARREEPQLRRRRCSLRRSAHGTAGAACGQARARWCGRRRGGPRPGRRGDSPSFTGTVVGAPGASAYPQRADAFLVQAVTSPGMSNLANADQVSANLTNWNALGSGAVIPGCPTSRCVSRPSPPLTSTRTMGRVARSLRPVGCTTIFASSAPARPTAITM